ncbi:actophorin-like [Littorina saxatilis]|uniref:ADF-H domain-containing protein n=1 Tax=Littorina saxatilis TaxID=31220 RepID=A0AAN9AJT5_9CAEN
MASGVAVDDCAKNIYQLVKMHGKDKLRYAVLRISDDLKKIVVDDEKMGTSERMDMEEPAHFMDVIRELPSDDGRYMIYDYPFEKEHRKCSKLILVMWVPSTIPIKKKMLYASSKDALKKACPDTAAEFQADCADDLCHDEIVAKLVKI